VLGVPHGARKEKALEAVAYLVVGFEELDKSSLSSLGPIRIKVSYKDPQEIKGSSLGFFIKKDSSGSKKDDEEQKEEEDGNLITIILFMETI